MHRVTAAHMCALLAVCSGMQAASRVTRTPDALALDRAVVHMLRLYR